MGAAVLDLDQVARDVVEPGQPAFTEIAARWPTVIRDGRIDRKALGAIVVADTAARRELEAMTHPRVWARMEEWLAATPVPVRVVEAALMVETGSWRRYDRLVVVSCSPDVQRRRLMERNGIDAAAADRWMAAQMPVAEKERVAHHVIRNDGSPEQLRAAVADVWQRLTHGE
jgi:dephospho-CoA kinase